MSKAQCILAIDTATGPCSVAVWKDGTIAAFLEKAGITQSVSLMPMVEQALKDAGITYPDLTQVAATVGPGSFTGIRVGLAAARGICFAGNIPGIGVTTMDVLAYAGKIEQPEAPAILSVLNAGKGEVYYQGYSLQPDWLPIFETRVGRLEDALASLPAPVLVAGNVAIEASGYTPIAATSPRADILAALVAAHGASIAAPMHPFYLRLPDAKPQKLIILS